MSQRPAELTILEIRTFLKPNAELERVPFNLVEYMLLQFEPEVIGTDPTTGEDIIQQEPRETFGTVELPRSEFSEERVLELALAKEKIKHPSTGAVVIEQSP